jgi:SAM-dependent methyltransferase
MTDEQEYVLGTGSDELDRLGFQHQVWAGHAARAWERAAFGPGQWILDAGCGPGFAAFDLARWVGERGRVHGVDASERFVEYLREQAAARGHPNVTAEVGDLTALELPRATFDGAWARWVLCFVEDADAAIARVAASLKRGGRFVVQDYLRYEGVMMAPEDPAFDRVFTAFVAALRAAGGDPHFGATLPARLERAGLAVEHVEPLSRVARPGSALWRWPKSFFDNFLPGLVASGQLAREELDAFDARWAEREKDPGAFFVSPPMIEVVAVKR